MEFFYLVAALVTAGASLASGLANLSAGSFKKRETPDLIFGIMLLCLFVCVLVPPTVLANLLSGRYFEKITRREPSLPFNFFPIFFIVIIVIHSRIDIIEKLRLEKTLRQREIGWNSLVQNMKLM
jgi:hypothetical protein